MTKTKDRMMILGDRIFAVPPLPLDVNRQVYPLCRQLSLKGALVDKVVAVGIVEALEKEEQAVLEEIAFACAQLADPTFTQDEFGAIPTNPVQLFDAFFSVARYQTGVWVPVTAPAEQGTGEAEGEASPQKSISTESSPA
jgi:hypothetical protein